MVNSRALDDGCTPDPKFWEAPPSWSHHANNGSQLQTPSGAWAGTPFTSVSTPASSSPVEITALAKIGGYGLFTSWLQLGDGTVKKDVLTVAANGRARQLHSSVSLCLIRVSPFAINWQA